MLLHLYGSLGKLQTHYSTPSWPLHLSLSLLSAFRGERQAEQLKGSANGERERQWKETLSLSSLISGLCDKILHTTSPSHTHKGLTTTVSIKQKTMPCFDTCFHILLNAFTHMMSLNRFWEPEIRRRGDGVSILSWDVLILNVLWKLHLHFLYSENRPRKMSAGSEKSIMTQRTFEAIYVAQKHHQQTDPLVSPAQWGRFLFHPLGAAEEAPCHNTFVKLSMKPAANCLHCKVKQTCQALKKTPQTRHMGSTADNIHWSEGKWWSGAERSVKSNLRLHLFVIFIFLRH